MFSLPRAPIAGYVPTRASSVVVAVPPAAETMPTSMAGGAVPQAVRSHDRLKTTLSSADEALHGVQGTAAAPVSDAEMEVDGEHTKGKQRRRKRSTRSHGRRPAWHASEHGSRCVLHSRRLRSPCLSYLKPGAQYLGSQKSGRAVYDVNVSIKHVDLANSFLCGYLRINGLSDDHPTLTTYFEGEIIGPQYSFITRRADWGTTETIDVEHWARFPAFKAMVLRQRKRDKEAAAATVVDSTGTHTQTATHAADDPQLSQNVTPGSQDHIFMRWKELLVLPSDSADRPIAASLPDAALRNSLDGVSFSGFYYICLDQSTGRISGMYFHRNSELYQQLSLDPQLDSIRTTDRFEFR